MATLWLRNQLDLIKNVIGSYTSTDNSGFAFFFGNTYALDKRKEFSYSICDSDF